MTTLGLLDGLGSKSNLIYWGRVLENIEYQIEDKKEYEMSLEEAYLYPLWLLASSEFIFSLLRRELAIKQDNAKSLDYSYSNLVKFSEQILTPESYGYVRDFEIIRNTLVHKGFPYSFSVPMKNANTMGNKQLYETVQSLMKKPEFFFKVKLMINAIKSETRRNKN